MILSTFLLLTNTKVDLYQPALFAVTEHLIAALVLVTMQETREMLIPAGSDGRTKESGKEVRNRTFSDNSCS